MDSVVEIVKAHGPMHEGQCIERLAAARTPEQVSSEIQHNIREGVLEADAEGRLCLTTSGKGTTSE